MTDPRALKNGHPADLAAALAQLQTRLPVIKKTSQAQYGNYADLADVSRELLPILGELGLSFSSKPTWVRREDGTREFVLAYKLRHISGDSDEGEYPLGQNQANHQQLGSAITYGRRYALCAITGAVAEDDDDGQSAATAGPVTGRQPRDRKPPVRAAGNLPRNRDGSVSRSQTTDEELADSGQMTDGQVRDHGRLERDVKGTGPQGTERLGETPPDDLFYDAPPPGAVPVPRPAGNPAQAIVMHFGRIGITDRDERLKILRRMTGRDDIASTNDLNAREGVQVKRELGHIGNDDAAGLYALLDEQEAAKP